MNRKFLFLPVVLVVTATGALADQFYDEVVYCRDLSSGVARLDCYDAAVDRSRQPSAAPAQVEAAPEPEPAASAERAAPVEPDTSAAPAAAAATTATAATAATAATSTPEISQEELFGKNSKDVQRTVEEVTGSESIDSISAQVTRLQQSGYDKVLITLDNGQVWQQIDSSRLRLKVGDEIRIERASLGSFMLQKKGSKRSMRVSRKD